MKKKSISIMSLILVFSLQVNVSAHPGRTDSNGGHTEKATGTYHYHNGGSSSSSSSSSSNSSKSTSSSKSTNSSKTSTSTTAKTQNSYKYLVASDIVVTINGVPINALRYDGAMYVKTADLSKYGFTVNYSSTDKTVTIKKGDITNIKGLPLSTPESKKIVNSNIIVNAVDSDVTTKLDSLNGEGNTYVKFNNLSVFGKISYDSNKNVASLIIQ